MINIAQPIIEQDEIEAVAAALRSPTIVQGPRVRALEESFAKLCRVRYAVAFNSGTAAIHAALHSYGINSGHTVITTPFTFIATISPIMMERANVEFVDIEPSTFN